MSEYLSQTVNVSPRENKFQITACIYDWSTSNPAGETADGTTPEETFHLGAAALAMPGLGRLGTTSDLGIGLDIDGDLASMREVGMGFEEATNFGGVVDAWDQFGLAERTDGVQ